jgi:hypothetical protein
MSRITPIGYKKTASGRSFCFTATVALLLRQRHGCRIV